MTTETKDIIELGTTQTTGKRGRPKGQQTKASTRKTVDIIGGEVSNLKNLNTFLESRVKHLEDYIRSHLGDFRNDE